LFVSLIRLVAMIRVSKLATPRLPWRWVSIWVVIIGLQHVLSKPTTTKDTLKAWRNRAVKNMRKISTEGSWDLLAEWFDEELKEALNSVPHLARTFPVFSSQNLALKIFSHGRGLSTLRWIQNGDTALLVPCSLGFSAEYLFENPYAEDLEAAVAAKPKDFYSVEQILAVQLTWEVLHLSQSTWKQYILLLPPVGKGEELFFDPRPPNDTLSQAILNLSDHVNHFATTFRTKTQETLELALECLTPSLLNKKYFDGAVTREEFEPVFRSVLTKLMPWAYRMAHTRSYALNPPPCRGNVSARLTNLLDQVEGPGLGRVMLPMGDFLNHESGAGMQLSTWKENGRRMGFSYAGSATDIMQESQMFANYFGQQVPGMMRCNAHVLVVYGFAEPDDQLDCVWISMRDASTSETVDFYMRDDDILPMSLERSLAFTTPEAASQDQTFNESRIRGLRQAEQLMLTEIPQIVAKINDFRMLVGSMESDSPSSNAVMDFVPGVLAVADGELRILRQGLEEVERRLIELLQVPMSAHYNTSEEFVPPVQE